MKITKLTAQNFMRLVAVEIRPDGSLVTIGGRNAQGKTSVLNAIQAAFGGAKAAPAEPVRKGQKTAEVIAETDEFVVKKEWSADGKAPRLSVTSLDGAVFASPQAMLDKLVGSISFDPLSFCRMPPMEQAALLRRLVGLDFSKEDAKRQGAYEKRTDINRECKRAQAVLDKMPAVPDDTPDQESSVQDIVEQLSIHQQLDTLRDRAKMQAAEIERLEEALTNARAALDKLNDQGLALKAKATGSAMELRRRLASIEETNKAVRVKAMRHEAEAEVNTLIEESEKLTQYIAEIDGVKAEATTKAKYPIDGLAVGDEQVIYRGVPFLQAAQSEQIRVSVAIGAALNPQLRVLLVRDGSLLDDDGMRALAEIADQSSIQVWVERVGEHGAKIIIEDGAEQQK